MVQKIGVGAAAFNPPRTFADFTTGAARIGTGLLQWSPADFWNATPVELRTALEGRLGLGGSEAPRPLTAADMAALMAKFPDTAAE